MSNNDFYSESVIPPIDEAHIKALVENPPVLCGCDDCPKDARGQYCKCITTVFQHKTHYQLYLKLIEQKIKSSFVEFLKIEN